MRILFYINTLEYGGAERVISNLANQFSDDAFEVILVTTYPAENEYRINDNVKRYYIESNIVNNGLIASNISRIIGLRKILKNNKPDAVVSFLPEPNFRSIIASLGLTIPVIISIRNDPNTEYANSFYRYAQKILYPLANGYVFQTLDARNWFPEKIRKKSAIIMNQVDESFFYSIKESEEYYVAIGRFVKQKNYSMMINGFKMFVNDAPSEKLLIFGDGEEKKEIEQLILENSLKNNVFLMGKSDNIPKILVKAKAFLMTSDYEGMPNAMLEAMAVGVPVIVTDCPCGGPRMIINNNENGILIPVKDEHALYCALKMIDSNCEIRRSISIYAKHTAKKFHPRVIYKQWKKYILKVVKSSKNS